MGYFFELRHANLIAYLTTPTAAAPRVSRGLVREALGAIAYGSHDSESVISRDEDWLAGFKRVAKDALPALEGEEEDELPSDELDTIVRGIRQELLRFDIFGLVVDDGRNASKTDQIDALARELSYSSRGNALILMPRSRLETSITVLDPIPAFAEALEHPDRWPGFLFWTSSGTCAMVALDRVDSIANAIRTSDADGTEAAIRDAGGTSGPRRLLHLSDLHFGSTSIAPNLVLLEAQLHDVVGQVDRVVITGDLFDSPRAEAAALFRNFNASLQRISGKPPVIIPGNHDIRELGNLGAFYRQMSNIGWQRIVVDEEIKVNFACFDSSESGLFARGEVSEGQLNAVGGALRNEVATNRRVEDHLTVALVHHHPFSFKTDETRTFVQRLLALVGMNEEKFLEMVEADRFLDWCARWRVSAVLHGHKHVARHISRRIRPVGAPAFDVTAIGCGSSLGAEGSPLSYVVLNWDERSRRWSTTFFESRNGGPFVRQAATSTTITN